MQVVSVKPPNSAPISRLPNRRGADVQFGLFNWRSRKKEAWDKMALKMPPLPSLTPKRKTLLKRLGMVGACFLAMLTPDLYASSRLLRNWLSSPGIQAKEVTSLPTSHENTITPEDQGDTNGCGSTSVAMGLNHLKGSSHFNRAIIDRQIRREDIYTTPDNVVSAARDFGVHAELYNNSNFEEIARHVIEGRPVIALVKEDRSGSNFKAHYKIISGYDIDENGKKTLKYVDPAIGCSYPGSWEYFEKKWRDIDMGGIQTGYNNLIIVLSNDPLPPGREVYNPLTTLASRSSDIVNTSSALVNGDVSTIVTNDLPKGNLFLFGILLLGLGYALTPNKQSHIDALMRQAEKLRGKIKPQH